MLWAMAVSLLLGLWNNGHHENANIRSTSDLNASVVRAFTYGFLIFLLAFASAGPLVWLIWGESTSVFARQSAAALRWLGLFFCLGAPAWVLYRHLLSKPEIPSNRSDGLALPVAMLVHWLPLALFLGALAFRAMWVLVQDHTTQDFTAPGNSGALTGLKFATLGLLVFWGWLIWTWRSQWHAMIGAGTQSATFKNRTFWFNGHTISKALVRHRATFVIALWLLLCCHLGPGMSTLLALSIAPAALVLYNSLKTLFVDGMITPTSLKAAWAEAHILAAIIIWSSAGLAHLISWPVAMAGYHSLFEFAWSITPALGAFAILGVFASHRLAFKTNTTQAAWSAWLALVLTSLTVMLAPNWEWVISTIGSNQSIERPLVGIGAGLVAFCLTAWLSMPATQRIKLPGKTMARLALPSLLAFTTTWLLRPTTQSWSLGLSGSTTGADIAWLLLGVGVYVLFRFSGVSALWMRWTNSGN